MSEARSRDAGTPRLHAVGEWSLSNLVIAGVMADVMRGKESSFTPRAQSA